MLCGRAKSGTGRQKLKPRVLKEGSRLIWLWSRLEWAGKRVRAMAFYRKVG